MMTRSIRTILLLLFISISGHLSAQDSLVVYDNTPVQIREFDQAKIQELLEDSDFDYAIEEANSTGLSVWQRFVRWLKQSIRNLLSFNIGSVDLGTILLYAIIIGLLAFAIYQLLKMNARRIFRISDSDGMDYEISEENIHVLDFDKLLKEAADTRQFKRAIRLTYLYALKILSNTQDIHWEPGKTNHDYSYEIKNPSVKSGFTTLGYFFENAWYGEFEVNETHYKEVKETFNHIRREAGS